MINRVSRIGVVTLFCALVVSTVFAQSLPPLVNVVTVHVKSGMRPEFEALQREATVARREAGITARYAYRVARGGSANEYIFVTPVEGLAEFDRPGGMAQAMGEVAWTQWVARIEKCTENRRVDTLRLRDDLSIPLAEGRTPTLIRLRRVELLPGGGQEYQAWLTENWVPAMRNAGMNGVYHYQDAFGLGQRTWIRIESYDSWADLEGHPVSNSLTAEAFTEVLANNDQLTHGPEVQILRVLPELSILP